MSKRATYVLLGVIVLLLVLFASTGAAWATTFSTPVDADYGDITNSVYLSQDDFPDGAPAAVLTASDSYTTSLAATVLAKAAGWTPALTSSASLSASAKTELVRLQGLQGLRRRPLDAPSSRAVKAALPGLAADKFVVLAGADQYQNAALIAGKVKELTGATPARVFIVPGDVYGSSLAVASVAAANGWPILLTPAGRALPGLLGPGHRGPGGRDRGPGGHERGSRASPASPSTKTIMGTTSTTDDPGARYSEALASGRIRGPAGMGDLHPPGDRRGTGRQRRLQRQLPG